MSGYLEVKYPFKSNLGLNPFKSWRRQWCILRPSPTCAGGSLAVYCSEAGAAAGTVDLPQDCVVRRAKSRTRPYAFAVFTINEPRKPLILLAAQSLQDSQTWMEKIRALLSVNRMLGTETLLKASYSVFVLPSPWARQCGVVGDGDVTLSPGGLSLTPLRARAQPAALQWRHVADVAVTSNADRNRICVVTVDSECPMGGGELRLSGGRVSELSSALKAARRERVGAAGRPEKLSRSDGDLRPRTDSDSSEVGGSSWYSGPSEVSLDDLDLIMSKEAKRIPIGHLSRCSGAGDLAPARPRAHSCTVPPVTPADDSMSDRRSLISIASGIYEEIPDLPEQDPSSESLYCQMGRDIPGRQQKEEARMEATDSLQLEEPTYESVSECIYATMRRTGKRYPPPPLPPRLPFGTTKLGSSWNSRMNCADGGGGVTRHSSLGSLPRCSSVGARPSAPAGEQAPGAGKRQPFSVFRKRLKSDSRIATSPKSDTSKENKDVETKKKKFDFAPTRDIFKNFKVSRKMKNLKIASGSLTKGETKSCEFLDETEHVTANRCSKSVECLEDKDYVEDDGDLSIEFNDDAVAALALPQEIVDLILRSREQLNKIRLKETQESLYMPMSPIIPAVPPAPIEHHYIVMAPKTNLA